MFRYTFQSDLHTSEFICVFDCTPCSQCSIETKRESNCRLVSNYLIHTNHIIDVFSDSLCLNIRIASI